MLAIFAPFISTTTNTGVEVEEREAACNAVGTYLDQLRSFSSPGKDEEVSSML
jgi:hypothetical protein